MFKKISMIAVVVVVVSAAYWLGLTTGKRTAERYLIGLSAMSDAAKLRFDINLKDILEDSNYEKALLALKNTIDFRISLLNTYDELFFVTGKDELKRSLLALMEKQTKKGSDTGEIEKLISRLEGK